MGTFDQVGSVYTCKPTLANTNNDRLTSVSGNHMFLKNNNDVLAIDIYNSGLQFFPRNVEAFFPNTIVFYLIMNSITTISNHHLLPFPRLVNLHLFKNRITYLESNLFSGLNSLKYVSFADNYINNVGLEINFPSTGEIYFQHNECIDMNAITASQITSLRFNLMLKCSPTISKIETILEGRFNLANITNEVGRLTTVTDTLAIDNNEMDVAVSSLKRKNLELETRIAMLEAAIENMVRSENGKVKKNIE